MDTVWRAIESHNVNVSTFARSSWTGREKQVDSKINVDSVAEAAKAYYRQIPSAFMIVSGDRDLLSAVSKITKEFEFRVHVWSWKNCLASVYTQQQEDKLIRVHLLDDYLEKIGFRETTFRVDRNTISPHSIVVLDPMPKATEIEEFLSCLRIPVYRYVCAKKRADASSEDLVIIPAHTKRMSFDDLVNLFEEAKAQLETHGLSVFTYMEYSQQYIGDSRDELGISNRFKELPEDDGENDDKDDDEDDGENDNDDDDNDSFIEVNRRSERQKSRLKKDEQKSRSRCIWRKYCKSELNCKYGHTKEEEDYLRVYGHKTARKHRRCQDKDCFRGSRCNFAHSEAELFCPTCGKTGAGHAMGECPERWQ